MGVIPYLPSEAAAQAGLMRDLHLLHKDVLEQRLEIPDQVRNDGI